MKKNILWYFGGDTKNWGRLSQRYPWVNCDDDQNKNCDDEQSKGVPISPHSNATAEYSVTLVHNLRSQKMK